VDFSQFEPKKMRFGRDLRQMRAFLWIVSRGGSKI
jgi:hypothetical protein